MKFYCYESLYIIKPRCFSLVILGGTSSMINNINIGDRFGRWTIKKILSKPRKYIGECDCGTVREVSITSLKTGVSKSCGCLRKERSRKNLGSKRKYKIGHHFSRWTIKDVGSKPGIYVCVCDCGTVREVSISSLTSGDSKSCGCLKKELDGKHRRIDIVGKKFSKLTVIARGDKPREWLCQCECGNQRFVQHTLLKQGKVTSCGCDKKRSFSTKVIFKDHT